MYRLEKYKVKKAFVRARVKMVREIYKVWPLGLGTCLAASHISTGLPSWQGVQQGL
jgi:hypothetical protein